MSVEVHKLQRLRVYRETTFGTDLTASLASYVDVPAAEGSITLKTDQDTLDPLTVQIYKDKHPTKVLGLKRGTLSFTMAMIGPAATTTNTQHTRNALGYILRDVMGGENLMYGKTVDDVSPAATDFTMSGSSNGGNGVFPGTAYGITLTNGIEWRIAKTAPDNSTSVTHGLATSAAPANGAQLYGTSTYYLTENPTESLQFALYGTEDNDRWLAMGCQLDSMAFNLTAGQLPTITFNFKCSNWHYGLDVGDGGISGYAPADTWDGAISEASYSGLNYPLVQSGYMYQHTVATATYSGSTSVLPISQESWAPAIQFVPKTGPNADQGVFGWVRNRVIPVIKGTFNLPYEDLTWYHHKINRTQISLQRVLGGAAGGTIIFDAPTVQIVDATRVEDGSLAYQQISWEAHHDAEGTATSSETSAEGMLRRSAFRLHFG